MPNWVRGEEGGRVVLPREHMLEVMTLGSSVSSNGSIEADAIVVRTFEELDARAEEVNI